MDGKAPDLKLPGGYTVRDRLGRGALGTSFLTFKRGAKEQRVVKVLDRPEWLDEVPVLRVPGVWMGGKSPAGDVAWIWSKHIPEGSLRDALDRGTLPARQFGDVLTGCLEILEAVHREGAVHGCLKPEDILLPAREGVVITDFGHLPLLRSKDEEAGSAYLYGRIVSRDARAPFTYLPPEALRSDAADPRVDVYAVGAILREGLEGKGGRPPIPEDLAELIQLLTGPPSSRYPSAKKARSLIEEVSGETWEKVPLIGDSAEAAEEPEQPFGGVFSFAEIPDRPVPVAVSLPGELAVFDLAVGEPASESGGAEPASGSGGSSGESEDEPEEMDPAEALEFLSTMKSKPKAGQKPPPVKKAWPEKKGKPVRAKGADALGSDAGAYGLVVMGVPGGTKREAIANLIGPLMEIDRDEAYQKATQPVISVLKGVTKLQAEKAFKRFKQAKVSARITTRLKKQS